MSNEQQEFIRALHELADYLKDYTKAVAPGSLIWDGKSYVKEVSTEKRLPSPYTLAWWSTFMAIIGLFECRDCEISATQLGYLRRELFGGMGSFLDFYLSELDGLKGEDIQVKNRQLEQLKEALSKTFKNLEQTRTSK